MVAQIIPGLHKDVWAIPQLFTIATYYPGLKNEDGGMFGTECFYFNYWKVVTQLQEELKQKISNDYHIKTQAGRDLFSEQGGSLKIEQYSQTDRINKISVAWIQFLSRNPTFKPSLSLQNAENIKAVQNQEYKYGRNRYVLSKSHDDIKNMSLDASAMFNQNVTPEMLFPGFKETPYFNSVSPIQGPLRPSSLSSDTWGRGFDDILKYADYYSDNRKGKSKEEYRRIKKALDYNCLNPLVHFPPDVTQLLSESLFFDPSNAAKYAPRIMAQYGANGAKILLRCAEIKRKVYYSEIIKPSFGIGFDIDFSVVGLNIRFNVPIQRFVGDGNTLTLWKEAGFYSLMKTSGSENTVYIPRSVFGSDDLERIDWFTLGLWERRDDWIQSWTVGGKIPTSISEICCVYNGVAISLRGLAGLHDLYPITIAHNDPDVLGQIIQVVTVLTTLVVAGVSGNIGGAIQMFTDITKSALMQAFPGAAAYINMGTMLITTNLIFKNFGKPDKDQVVQNALLGASTGIVTSAMQSASSMHSKTMIRGLIDAYDKDTDTLSVINAIAELKEERLRPKSTPVVGGGGGTPKAEEKKSSGLLMAGAVVLGALAVKKLLKKGK